MQEEKEGKAGRQKTSSPRPSSLREDPTLYQVSVGEGPDSFSTPLTDLQLSFRPSTQASIRPEYKHTLCICIPRECPWNSAGKNTGVGSLFLLQGIFPTQGLNPGLLLGRQILYHWATWEAPWMTTLMSLHTEWGSQQWFPTKCKYAKAEKLGDQRSSPRNYSRIFNNCELRKIWQTSTMNAVVFYWGYIYYFINATA